MKVFRVFTPFVADVFIWRSPRQRLEPFGKVACLYEGFKALTQLQVRLVEVAMHGLFFDRPKGNDHGFLLLGEDGRARLFRIHRQVLDRTALLPFCDRLRIDAVALGQLAYALLTILYLFAGRLCRSGLRVENLSRNASFSHFEMTP